MKIIQTKYFLYLFALLIILIRSQQTTAQQLRYSNQIFDKVDTLKEVEYARAEWLNNQISLLSDYNIHVHEGENIVEERPLYMDIFSPNGDTIKKRPAIIFLHSGGFLTGSRHNSDMVAMCDSFARKGYVTVRIDYRIGMGATVNRIFGVMVGLQINEINGYRAAYRGIQDLRAAIRFLKHNADNYGIDTTKIFTTGSSAGAIIALNNIYIDNEEINYFAYLKPPLGTIDAVGVQGYGSKANAITSLWGAIENPEIIENDSTPVFLVHGTDDNIVPYKKGVPLTALIPQEYKSFIQLNLPETYGSYCIDTALNNRNINHETYFVEGKKHEFYGVATGKFYEDGPNEYWDTIQWKTTRFFFEQFKPKAEAGYYTNNLDLTFYDVSNESVYSFWDFGDGTTSYGNTIVHSYAAQGFYRVKLTTCNENMACDTLSISVTAGIPDYIDQIAQNGITVYPNPVNNLLNVKGINQSFSVKIFDLTGRTKIIGIDISNNTIDVSKLKSGIYFIEISTNSFKVTRKIIKVE